jgi:predicted RNase H-like HicB family nuclease
MVTQNRGFEIIFEVEEAEEGGYVAAALGVSIFTEAESLEELRANVQDAVRSHYGAEPDGPRIIRLHFVRQEVIAA